MIDRRLLVLGKLDNQIRWLAGHTHTGNLCMDFDDLVQEGYTKVLTLVNDPRYGDKSLPDLISICYHSLVRFYFKLIRTSKAQANTGIVIDLEMAYDLFDPNYLDEVTVDFQISQLRELFDDTEIRIMECLIYPTQDLVDIAIRRADGKSNTEVRITKAILADYLGMSRAAISRAISNMRIKSEPILGFNC
jgi:hypothetical protein